MIHQRKVSQPNLKVLADAPSFQEYVDASDEKHRGARYRLFVDYLRSEYISTWGTNADDPTGKYITP